MSDLTCVWLLWGSDDKESWLEDVYADKAKAEAKLRHLEDAHDGRGPSYWVSDWEISADMDEEEASYTQEEKSRLMRKWVAEDYPEATEEQKANLVNLFKEV